MTQKKNRSVVEIDLKKALVNDCAMFGKTYCGDNYFSDLAQFLANKVDVEYVLIGYIINGQTHKVNTVALYAHGNIAPNMSYPLTGTPCENVMGRNCCYYPAGVQEMFPTDKELQELNIHSYIGTPLFDLNRRPLGIIVLMDSETIPNAGIIEKALGALAPRTEQELQLFVSLTETIDQ